MRYSILIFLLIFLSNTWIKAEQYPYNFTNTVYDDLIKSVTLQVNKLPTNMPILQLNSNQKIHLEFDDLLTEERILYYRIIHCNQDWTPSALRDLDYLNGFNDERLRNYEYSVNTRTQYIHYWQEFPNKDTQFRVSGNYLLIIYEDNIEYPIITRRFMISENQAFVSVTGNFVGDIAKTRFNQDFQFDVNIAKMNVRNPVDEFSLVVLQNEDWFSEKIGKPNFLGGNNLRFNKIGQFSFPGLAEYREFDTRSLQIVRRGVQMIERNTNSIDVLLTLDEPRRNKVSILTFDFNGKFFINNFDALAGRRINQVVEEFTTNLATDQTIRQSLRDSIVNTLPLSSQNSNYTFEERNINSDYTKVIFTLRDNIDLKDNESIYILGGLNDWEPREEFRMKEVKNSPGMYQAEIMLKQGYYNYYYGVVNDKGIDYETMEGSWNETENDYNALIYYRGFGDLSDRLVGYGSFNSASFLTLR